jgi:hypothetical protein
MILAALMLLAQEGVIDRFKRAHGDFLEGQYRREHPVQAGWLVQPETEIHNVSGAFDFDNLWLQAATPLPVAEDAFAYLGLRCEHRTYDRNATFGLLDEDETLTTAYLATGGGVFTSPDLLLAAYAGFGVATDRDKSLERDDYRVQGRLIGAYRASPAVIVRAGLDVSEVDDRARVVPLIGGAWRITEKLRVDALLPKWLLVTWEAAQRVYLAAGYEITGEEYHLFSASGVEGELRIDEYRFYLEARWHVIEKAGVWLRVGVSTGPVELETAAGSVKEWQEPAPYIEVGLSFDLF